MEVSRQDEIQDLSLSPPSPGSMQIAARNGFGHNIDYMSQAYLRNRSCSQIDIELDDSSNAIKDRPLPIYLKVLDMFLLIVTCYTIIYINSCSTCDAFSFSFTYFDITLTKWK